MNATTKLSQLKETEINNTLQALQACDDFITYDGLKQELDNFVGLQSELEEKGEEYTANLIQNILHGFTCKLIEDKCREIVKPLIEERIKNVNSKKSTTKYLLTYDGIYKDLEQKTGLYRYMQKYGIDATEEMIKRQLKSLSFSKTSPLVTSKTNIIPFKDRHELTEKLSYDTVVEAFSNFDISNSAYSSIENEKYKTAIDLIEKAVSVGSVNELKMSDEVRTDVFDFHLYQYENRSNKKYTYYVNRYGFVISLEGNKPRVLRPSNNGNGYIFICPSKKSKIFIHVMTASTFLQNMFPYRAEPIIHHLDGNKKNNHISNLEYLPNGTIHRKIYHNNKYHLSSILIYDKSMKRYLSSDTGFENGGKRLSCASAFCKVSVERLSDFLTDDKNNERTEQISDNEKAVFFNGQITDIHNRRKTLKIQIQYKK